MSRTQPLSHVFGHLLKKWSAVVSHSNELSLYPARDHSLAIYEHMCRSLSVRDLYTEEREIIPIQYEWESYELSAELVASEVDSPDFLDTSFMNSLELEYPLELASSLDSEYHFGSIV